MSDVFSAIGIGFVAVLIYRHFKKRQRRMDQSMPSGGSTRFAGDYYPASEPDKFDGGNAPQIAVTGWGEF